MYDLVNSVGHVYYLLSEDPVSACNFLSLHPSAITSPLVTAIIYTFAISSLCWVLSLVTLNYSWTDRLWSITPILYVYIFAAKDLYALWLGHSTVEYRLIAIFTIVLFWGIRLTYNFYRKGGYNMTSQDYRWTFLSEILNFVVLQLFNIVFIALYQNVLLLLITLPCYYIYQHRGMVPLSWIDYGAIVLASLFLLGETIADQQQWNFHELKSAHFSAREQKKQPTHLFLTTGLWRYSRHPNFFCEQMIWVMIYLCSATVSMVRDQSFINWTIIGSILLVLLFQGSTTFTEYITKSKYPTYVMYQKSTSRLIPWWPSKIKKI